MGQNTSTYTFETRIIWKNSNPNPIPFQYFDTIKQYLIKKLIDNNIAFEAHHIEPNCIKLPRGNTFDYISFESNNITYITYARKSLTLKTIYIDFTKQYIEHNCVNAVEQIIDEIKKSLC